eukprot:6584198-Ditylum_brightwellii.AAC.1
MNVKEFANMVESQQRGLNKQAESDMEVKSRRANFKYDSPKGSMDNQSILQIPNVLLHHSPKSKRKQFFVGKTVLSMRKVW